ncbi:MAG: CDP-alcohol phosphatidyltransferase family protein [Candidatus Jordarchaeum sp.]|uniref:CDP-alcohol phosphatidyltransferase family protein n=1 Tax=Candidatus Jordarchaeum sp. TaxID=2823881 RepID=UPI00404A9791
MPSKYRIRRIFRPIVLKMAKIFVRLGFSPNQVTILTLCFSLFAFFAIYFDLPVLYGVFVFVSGLLDGVDGTLAKITESASAKGGFLDSIIDRYSDFIILLGFLFWKGYTNFYLLLPLPLWVIISIIGFIMVSYTRSRGELIGIDLDIGIAGRSERLFIISVSSILYLFDGKFPIYGLILAGVLANITALYRFTIALKNLRGNYNT